MTVAQTDSLERPLVKATTFEHVYRAYVTRVSRWAARLGSPWIDPEDLTHDLFVKLRDHWSALPEDVNFDAYLFTMTANLVTSRRRVEKFRRWFRVPAEAGRQVASPTRTAEDALDAKDTRALVSKALDSLSDRDRRVLVLFELEGHSGQEVAQMVGARPEAVWVQLHRARKRFAEAIDRLGRRPS